MSLIPELCSAICSALVEEVDKHHQNDVLGESSLYNGKSAGVWP